MKTYYYLYQIKNLINNKIYIGVHKTNNMDDGYMGSGKILNYAIKKYGIENFEKTILKTFDSAEAMFTEEAEIVNKEFLARHDVYNLALGGNGGSRTAGKVIVIDPNSNDKSLCVALDDPRYLSGELISIQCGKVIAKNKNNTRITMNVTDPRYLSGEFVHTNTGRITVKDISGNTLSVSVDDPRYLSGELMPINKNKILVKDINGNCLMVLADDPRYLSGELTTFWSDKTHSEETKEKIKNTMAETKHQQGKNNSQYGTRWISNIELKETKRINKDEPIPDGWVIGCRVWKQIERTQNKQRIREFKELHKKEYAERLYNQYIEGKYKSIREFIKINNLPSIYKLWKKYIPEYKRSARLDS